MQKKEEDERMKAQKVKMQNEERKKNAEKLLPLAIISRYVDSFVDLMHLFGSLNGWTLLRASHK